MKIWGRRALAGLGTAASLAGIHFSLQAAPAPLQPATAAQGYQRADSGVRNAAKTLFREVGQAEASEQGLSHETARDVQVATGTLATLQQLQNLQMTVDAHLAILQAQTSAPSVHAATGASGGDGGGGDGSGGDN